MKLSTEGHIYVSYQGVHQINKIVIYQGFVYVDEPRLNYQEWEVVKTYPKIVVKRLKKYMDTSHNTYNGVDYIDVKSFLRYIYNNEGLEGLNLAKNVLWQVHHKLREKTVTPNHGMNLNQMKHALEIKIDRKDNISTQRERISELIDYRIGLNLINEAIDVLNEIQKDDTYDYL